MNTTFSQELLDKYSNTYFRELVILYHIRELELKANKCIAEDRKPFHDPNFLKELADMYILLKLMKYHDSQFRTLIKTRLQKFESKIERSITPSKMQVRNITFENKQDYDTFCLNLSCAKMQELNKFFTAFHKLLDEYNAKASIYVHEDQLCIYVTDERVAEKAYNLVDKAICDIISISEA